MIIKSNEFYTKEIQMLQSSIESEDANEFKIMENLRNVVRLYADEPEVNALIETNPNVKIAFKISMGILEGFGVKVSGSFENCLSDDKVIVS